MDGPDNDLVLHLEKKRTNHSQGRHAERQKVHLIEDEQVWLGHKNSSQLQPPLLTSTEILHLHHIANHHIAIAPDTWSCLLPLQDASRSAIGEPENTSQSLYDHTPWQNENTSRRLHNSGRSRPRNRKMSEEADCSSSPGCSAWSGGTQLAPEHALASLKHPPLRCRPRKHAGCRCLCAAAQHTLRFFRTLLKLQTGGNSDICSLATPCLKTPAIVLAFESLN